MTAAMGECRGADAGGEWGKTVMGLLAVLDSILSIFVFSPLVVGYWRGCWQLMDVFLFPDNQLYSVLTSLAIGLLSGLLFCLIQGPLNSLCDHNKRPIIHLLISRLYTLVYSVCVVNHWRGVWSGWDLFTGTSWQSGATSLGIGLLTLALTRGLKNILAPPFLVVPDHPTGYFDVPTLFKAEVCCVSTPHDALAAASSLCFHVYIAGPWTVQCVCCLNHRCLLGLM